ncbi:FUSC family protein [Streptomyces griseochromogenes]|uniref:FUSC family protein n=1 Tax=Streptomyces griseochromogenes TaxID=68214 RepID=UPI0037B59805
MPARHLSPDRVRAARQAVRVTVAATAVFYPAVYALHQPVIAVYALFTPIALGLLSSPPGGSRRRARVVLLALPFALALTALGTVLAVTTGAAVAGMVVVGFALTFGAVCGPAPAGVAPGLLLFYVLACFPPYAPDALPQRLVGVLLGTALLLLCELLLLPAPPDPPYSERIADALDLAATSAVVAAHGRGTAPDRARLLSTTGRGLRLSQQPPGSRPTGAGRTHRALAEAGAATRRLLDQLARTTPTANRDLASETLLRGIAAACTRTADALRGAPAVPGPEVLEEMAADFVAHRGRSSGSRTAPAPALLVHRSTVLATAASAITVQAAVAVALGGRRTLTGLPREQFWYARPSTVRLWAARLTGNVTRRSVCFQNAVRTAVGLGAARLVAGALDLSHGFWVLLAVLTLGRTTAGATWSAVRSAAVGTLLGALAAGVLLFEAGGAAVVSAVVLVPAMLLAFTLGPIAGPAWAQGLFTLVVACAFSQLSPVTWRLAEARLLDVLTGCAIGLLCGLLAWPSGARGEVRHSMAELLRAAAPLVEVTAAATVAPGTPDAAGRPAEEAVRLTRRRLRIAEAAYAQYRTEAGRSPADGGSDWLAALNCAGHALVGAHWLPRLSPGPMPPDARHWARESAGELADALVRAADFPPGGVRVRRTPIPRSVLAAVPAPALPALVDVEVWFSGLGADLAEMRGDSRPVRSRAA